MVSEYLAVEANKDTSGDPLLTLITVTHAQLIPSFRCVLDQQAIVSRGNTFVPAGFSYLPPEQTREGLKPGRFRIENIESTLIETLRAIAGTDDPPEATIEFVYASAPDNVEVTWPSFVFRDAKYDDVIDIALALPDLSVEPAIKYRFTRSAFPGLIY